MPTVATFDIEYLQYLGPDGTLVRDDLPEFAKDRAKLVELFKNMLMVRSFDTKAVALQRTGKLGTYASCLGHEATHIGIGSAMQYDDVFAPSYREYGAQFMRGVKPREVLMYWGGDERGNDFSGPAHDYSWCVPIGTQNLHAAGAALAFKLRGEKRVAVTCCGDGGSSKTDTYAAINSAGAFTLPPWPLRARLSAKSIAPRTAMMSLPSTCRHSRPPARPFCARVLAPVCALRGTEIAQPLLMMHWMKGRVNAPAELIAA